MSVVLTPELVLAAYQQGIFPMAEAEPPYAVYWYAPDPRAILPLDGFHVPKTLVKLVRKGKFTVTTDVDFAGVIRGCAARPETWISPEIISLYETLHTWGFAHSIECWQGEALVGGLYGIALGGAFFGESMFHHARDASKVALVHLVERLRQNGFVLLDTQFTTPHLARFGVIEIPRAVYESRLRRALRCNAHWSNQPAKPSP